MPIGAGHESPAVTTEQERGAMALQSTDRPIRPRFAFLRRNRLTIAAAAAPLAVLLAATMITAAPTNGAPSAPGATPAPEQATENPNYRRVSLTSPGATIEILGQPEPFDTEAFAGEVDLARPQGTQAMNTANLVLRLSGQEGAFGEVFVSIRPGIPTDFQYDQSTQSIIFNPGLEFEVESVPGIVNGGDPLYLYTAPIRLLPTETVADPQFPPFGQTFRVPSLEILWDGADGVTGSEPVGLLTDFDLTVTHPA
ncbi:hypothetical protein L0U85_12935 [Glycomyces sp. L485]|nr:hypothetical protein [Glycomyces sp. L485]